jgi:P-type E1-E2 ATPase
MEVQINNDIKKYKVLHHFEFTSSRKRMSVLVKEVETGIIKLLTKGADQAIAERSYVDKISKMTLEIIDQNAEEGLRTLMLAEKMVTEEELYGFETQI